MNKTKIFFASAIICVLFLHSLSDVYAYTCELSITKSSQTRSNWCWAACAKMVGDYYGRQNTQTDICRHVKGSIVNETASLSEVTEAIEYATNLNAWQIGVAAFSLFYPQLNEAKPPVIRVGWYNGGGHVYVVSGVSEASGITVDSLRLIDPINGVAEKYYPYYQLCNGINLDSGSGYYTHTWWTNVAGI